MSDFFFLFPFGQMPHGGPTVYKSKCGEEILDNNHWMSYHASLVPEPHDQTWHQTSESGIHQAIMPALGVAIDSGTWDANSPDEFLFLSFLILFLELYFVFSGYKNSRNTCHIHQENTKCEGLQSRMRGGWEVGLASILILPLLHRVIRVFLCDHKYTCVL